MALDAKCNSLRTAETGEKTLHCAAWRNPIDRIEAGCRWSGHVEVIVEAECQMIRRNAGLEGGVNKNLFAGAYLENTSRPVADIQISIMIESDTCRDSHTFCRSEEHTSELQSLRHL